MILFNIVVENVAQSQLGSQLIIPVACFKSIQKITIYYYLSTLTVYKPTGLTKSQPN